MGRYGKDDKGALALAIAREYTFNRTHSIVRLLDLLVGDSQPLEAGTWYATAWATDFPPRVAAHHRSSATAVAGSRSMDTATTGFLRRP